MLKQIFGSKLLEYNALYCYDLLMIALHCSFQACPYSKKRDCTFYCMHTQYLYLHLSMAVCSRLPPENAAVLQKSIRVPINDSLKSNLLTTTSLTILVQNLNERTWQNTDIWDVWWTPYFEACIPELSIWAMLVNWSRGTGLSGASFQVYTLSFRYMYTTLWILPNYIHIKLKMKDNISLCYHTN